MTDIKTLYGYVNELLGKYYSNYSTSFSNVLILGSDTITINIENSSYSTITAKQYNECVANAVNIGRFDLVCNYPIAYRIYLAVLMGLSSNSLQVPKHYSAGYASAICKMSITNTEVDGGSGTSESYERYEDDSSGSNSSSDSSGDSSDETSGDNNNSDETSGDNTEGDNNNSDNTEGDNTEGDNTEEETDTSVNTNSKISLTSGTFKNWTLDQIKSYFNELVDNTTLDENGSIGDNIKKSTSSEDTIIMPVSYYNLIITKYIKDYVETYEEGKIVTVIIQSVKASVKVISNMNMSISITNSKHVNIDFRQYANITATEVFGVQPYQLKTTTSKKPVVITFSVSAVVLVIISIICIAFTIKILKHIKPNSFNNN